MDTNASRRSVARNETANITRHYCYHKIMTIKFGTDTDEGADITMYWKILIFLAYFAVQCASLILNYHKPFLSLYWSILLCVGLIIWIIDNFLSITITKQLFLGVHCILMNLWRISRISDDLFTRQFGGFMVNHFVYRRSKYRFNQNQMEWFSTMLLSLNILWAVAMDSVIFGSYYNAGCGLILTLTVPLPSSIGRGTPGYQIQVKGQWTLTLILYLVVIVYMIFNLLYFD